MKCIVCKSKFEEDYSGLSPSGPYCSNQCVGQRRKQLFEEIPDKHGITLEKFKAILADFHSLPSYGQR